MGNGVVGKALPTPALTAFHLRKRIKLQLLS